MEEEIIYTKKNNQDFLKTLEEGVLIHGIRGQFAFALSRILLEKMNDFGIEEGVKITATTRKSIQETLKSIVKHAINTSIKTKTDLSTVLKPFLNDESLEIIKGYNDKPQDVMEKVTDLTFTKRLEIVEESDNTKYRETLQSNKIHILAIPSNSICNKIREIEKFQTNEPSELIFVDTAKGDHNVPESQINNVVLIAGANFHDQMIHPSGMDIAGKDPVKVDKTRKLFHSKTLRPTFHKNPEAVKKARDWKNLAALTVSFLSDGLDENQKSKIAAEFFAIMIECGEKYGICKEDWISNSGVADMFGSLTEGRNHEAGKILNDLNYSTINNIDDFITQVNRKMEERRGEKTTIESLNTLKQYLESHEYDENSFIKMFRKIISSDIQTKDQLSEVKEQMRNELLDKKRLEVNINEKVLERIKELIKFLNFIVHNSGYRQNTVGMLIHYGLKEIYENFQHNIKIDDLIVTLEKMLQQAFSKESENPDFTAVSEMAEFLSRVNKRSNNRETTTESNLSILQIVAEESKKLGIKQENGDQITKEDTQEVIKRIMEIPLSDLY